MPLALLPKPQVAPAVQVHILADRMSIAQRLQIVLSSRWNRILIILLLVLLCSQLFAYLFAKVNASRCSRRRRVRFLDDYKDVEHVRIEAGFRTRHDSKCIIFDSDTVMAKISPSVSKNR